MTPARLIKWIDRNKVNLTYMPLSQAWFAYPANALIANFKETIQEPSLLDAMASAHKAWAKKYTGESRKAGGKSRMASMTPDERKALSAKMLAAKRARRLPPAA